MATTQTPSWHGTLSGYSNHRCRCDACTAANKDYQRERRARDNPKGAKTLVELWACDCAYNWTPYTCGECGKTARTVDYTPVFCADVLAQAVSEVVESFTAPNGAFVHDDLTQVEYESLRGALRRYEAVLEAAR